MKINKKIKILIVITLSIVSVFFVFSSRNSNQLLSGSDLWKFVSSQVQPVVSTWDVKFGNNASTSGNFEVGGYASVSGDIRFFGEIQPDGVTCSNGQILKRTAANDWDCAADATGGGGGTQIEVGVGLDCNGGTNTSSVSFSPSGFNVTVTPLGTTTGFFAIRDIGV